jgi:hypothetical protein
MHLQGGQQIVPVICDAQQRAVITRDETFLDGVIQERDWCIESTMRK